MLINIMNKMPRITRSRWRKQRGYSGDLRNTIAVACMPWNGASLPPKCRFWRNASSRESRILRRSQKISQRAAFGVGARSAAPPGTAASLLEASETARWALFVAGDQPMEAAVKEPLLYLFGV